MDLLPNDIVFHVLSWLPVKTLLRLRSVSSLWRTTIDAHDFARTQLTRAREEPTPLLLSGPTTKAAEANNITQHRNFLMCSLNCKVHAFQGSCNGLLCFTTHRGVVAILFNPIRTDLLHLPPEDPSPGRRKYGLGFDSNTNTYKVVSVSVFVGESKNNVTMRARVWTQGSMSWREIASKPACPVVGRAVSADGAIHWIGDDHDNNLGAPKIVSFDVGKEEFSLRSCPEVESGVCHLVDLRGALGLVDCSLDTHIEIWVLKKNKGWVKEYKIQINAPEEVADNCITQVIGFWGGGEGEILLRYMQSYFSYKPEGDEMRYRHIPWLHADTQLFTHVSSLVSLSGFLPN